MESALSLLGLCPCRGDHTDQSPVRTEPQRVGSRCVTLLATQNEGNWVEAKSQSHGTLMGENVQRSGWPM